MTRSPSKPRLFVEGKLAPEPRIEAALPCIAIAFFALVTALVLADVFLGWTAGVAKAASGKVESGR